MAVLWLGLGACLSKPDRPTLVDSCGDAVIQTPERCDDGNADNGDGCSSTCEIEAWFECPTAGTLCHPITELQWLGAGTPLAGIGGAGGGDFAEDCRDLGLSITGTVVVGIAGGTDTNGNQAISNLRGICASIAELRRDGRIRWRDEIATVARGTNPTTGDVVKLCADDEVATGFLGSAENFASGIRLVCQALAHADGKLALGTPRRLDPIGPDLGTPQDPQSCGPLEIARSVEGRSGAVLDRFTLRCVPTTMVVCGDGAIVEPETCDDGNAIPGDGCNERCDGA